MRLPFVAVWAVLLLLTWRLGRLHSGRPATAWMATCMLAFTPMFAYKVVEIRPDGIAVALGLAHWLALAGGIRAPDASATATRLRFFFAGLSLGVAILFTQKILMALPAVAICAVIHVFDASDPGQRSARLRSIGLLGAGIATPLLSVFAAYAIAGQLRTFLDYSLWLNIRWARVVPRWFALRKLALDSPILIGAGGVGLLMAWRSALSPAGRAGARYVVPLALTGFLAMQLVSPAPWPQYLLNHMPLLAILAAEALMAGAVQVQHRSGGRLGGVATAWATMLLLAVAPGGSQIPGEFDSNVEQLAAVRYVQTRTRPSDAILDGVTGSGVFRPHAFFYAHINWDIRGMIPMRWRAELEQGLVSGRIAPEFVLLDDDIAYLSPTVTAYVRQHYRPGPFVDHWEKAR